MTNQETVVALVPQVRQQMMQLMDAVGALGRQQVSGWTTAGCPLVRWQEVGHRVPDRSGGNARVLVGVQLGGIA